MRLIDADLLIERIKETEYIWDGDHDGHEKHDISDLVRTIEIPLIANAPTIDAVEVVRCRDCKWYDKREGCLFSTAEITWNDYCSYGERANNGRIHQ